MDIGLRSSLHLISFSLGIALIRAIFHNDGNVDFAMQLLSICVKGDAKCSATSLINLTGILSGPHEF